MSLRSDAYIESKMDNRNLTYRKGYPQLPPLPVTETRQGARALVREPQGIIDRSLEICQDHHLYVSNMYFAFRVPAVRQHDEKHYLTLVIAADLREDPPVHHLIIQLRKSMLQDNTHERLFIEIIDDRVVCGLFSFGVRPEEEALLNAWQWVPSVVIEEIKRQKQAYVTLQLAHRGLQKDPAHCPATIIITTPTAANDDWLSLIIPRIHQRLSSVLPPLVIELLCGASMHATSEEVTVSKSLYNNTVTMGSYIGQKTLSEGTGTVGGVVTLQNGKHFALSNHHVVRNEDVDKVLEKLSVPGYPAPLKPGEPSLSFDKHRYTVPSNEDHTTYIADRLRDRDQLMKIGGPEAQEGLTAAEKLYDTAIKANRNFGTLHASSGLCTVKAERLSGNPKTGGAASNGKPEHRFLLDWSLIALDCPTRSMTNKLPVVEQKSFRNHPMFVAGQPCNTWTVMSKSKCDILRDEVHVGKFGRTTSFTYGYINCAHVIINHTPQGGQYKDMATTYAVTDESPAIAFSMLPWSATAVAVGKGDSGSIIMHAPTGTWLGLLFGEAVGTNAALFTPIDIVLRDIEKVTGQKVVNPKFDPK